MNGSDINQKYKKVHFGSLVNFDIRLPIVHNWLKENLFFRQGTHNVTGSNLIPIENDYSHVASSPKNIMDVCAQMTCNELDTYKVMEGGVAKDHKISRSFVMEPVFKTNDAIMRSKQVYCPDRLSMVEMDLVQHLAFVPHSARRLY